MIGFFSGIFKSYSQDYLISFTGTGASTTIDSVKVENLTQGTHLTVLGTDILHLGPLGISEKATNNEILKVFPNPMQGQADVSFFVKKSGIVQLIIYDIAGKKALQKTEILNRGTYRYKIACLKQGMYFIYINGEGFTYTCKLISQNPKNCEPIIEFSGSEKANENIARLKSTNATVNMAFSNGDIMRFTAYSNNYYNEKILVPSSNLNLVFSFSSTLASLSTDSIVSITLTTATAGGKVSNDGGALVTEKGICYNTSANPTTTNSSINCGSDTGSFIANLIGLSPSTTYYVRAYAINNDGTAYGNQVDFTTLTPATLAVLTTTTVTAITPTAAMSGGNISSDGGAMVTARGICYSLNPSPTTANSVINNGSGTGIFTSNISGLTASTAYFVRAFASNIIGTAYGNQFNFTTLNPATLAVLTTTAVSAITPTAATSGGDITSDGGAVVTTRGICYSLNSNPTTSNSVVNNGSGTGVFISNITGLTATTIYYVRAFASNIVGTAYGNQVNFTTSSISTIPVLTTTAVSAITPITATSGGEITSDGGASVTARGICYSINSNPTTLNSVVNNGNGTGIFTSNISGLTASTIYNVRAFAINTIGTAYGNQVNFTTSSSATIPVLTTSAVTTITAYTAVSGGNISSNGGTTVTTRGICYSVNTNPTTSNTIINSGSGTGLFISNLSGLISTTTYYVKAFAINSLGTAYGNQISFTTLGNTTLPILSTANITAVSTTIATSGGNITYDGGTVITSRGICYSLSTNPTIANSIVNSGSGSGSFISNLSGLTASTIYYVRAFATNILGTSYGNQISFTTSSLFSLATLTTTAASVITTNSATSGGNISSNGGATVTVRGVCYNINTNPTTANSVISNGSGNGSYTSSLINLIPNTTYFIRAYATNSMGTAYGNEISFTTFNISYLPTISTINVSTVSENTAIFGGIITSDGGYIINSRGICYAKTTNPTTNSLVIDCGSGMGSFSNYLQNLLKDTTYYVRAYATNAIGTAYGNQISFIPSNSLQKPIVETFSVHSITTNSAITCSKITNYGGSSFTGNGICYSTNPEPTKADNDLLYNSTGYLIVELTNLTPATTYYVRAYASKNAVITYGNQISFTTHSNGSLIKDIDDNSYDTIHIGNQIWLKQNLKTTHYQNGDSITINPQWNSLTNGAYSWYNNNISNKNIYGALYNWYAVNDSRGLCPSGWHIPTDNEWGIMLNNIGGSYLQAGDKLKDFSGASSNTEIIDEYGFTALAAGEAYSGSFSNISSDAYWWTSSEQTTYNSNAWYYTIDFSYSSLNHLFTYKTVGNSVRCISNNNSPSTLPTVITLAPDNITDTSANFKGNVINDGGVLVTSRGICYSTIQNPTTVSNVILCGTGTGLFNNLFTSLSSNTKYYLKAFAVNSIGTVFGDQIEFKTLPSKYVVTDINGNFYDTIHIGTQIWLKQNLNTSRYNNGDSIPKVTDYLQWGNLYSGAYCWYNNDSAAYENPFGKLYNFYAVSDARNLCPEGWKIPTDAEWTDLTNYLGGENVAGSKLKETGISHWGNYNSDATNEFNFTALPGFKRNYDGYFDTYGPSGYLWSSTANGGSAWFRIITNVVQRTSNSKRYGLYVRCIKAGNSTKLLPTVTTMAISGLTDTTAISGGNVISDGGATVTVKGICYGNSLYPNILNSTVLSGNGLGSYISNLSGLISNTTYYLRAYAVNNIGIIYGNQVIFKTSLSGQIPTLTTTVASSITSTTAISGGNISTDGGVFVKERGICYNTISNPTTTTHKVIRGTGIGSFTANLLNLKHDSTYFVRAYAINNIGIAYGNQISFTTPSNVSVVTDIDGNGYDTVQIGIQKWLKQNLKVTKYRNGNIIENVTDNSQWSVLTTGAYCWYNNLIVNKAIYGALYNYYTVTDSRGLCPTGWHTPSDAEWTTMIDYLGGDMVAGNLLKEAGTSHWESINPGVLLTNGSGFTALPGGYQQTFGPFTNLTGQGYWWCYTQHGYTLGWNYTIASDYTVIAKNAYIKAEGLSVRCVADSVSLVNIPTLNTLSASFINSSSLITGGNITNDGGTTITERGICYSTSSNPTIANPTLYCGSDIGSFNAKITNLTPNTTYYLRAYAINCAGTSYGNQIAITTPPSIQVPSVTSSVVTSITDTSAVVGGNVTSSGGATVSSRGICYSISSTPTTANNIISCGTGIGLFTANLSNLTPATTYYMRAFAISTAGTVYGNQMSFTTVNTSLAVVSTTAATSVSTYTATSGGNITSDGGISVTARGICFSTTTNPTTLNTLLSSGSGTGSFISNLTGLLSNTSYYVRAYATNSLGTAYGNEINFTTNAIIPCVNFTVTHSAGSVAPVTKTVNYGTVSTTFTGSLKCWITQNLGSDQQAISATDTSEAAAGWYWQFNRKQGYKNDGTTLTPSVTWDNTNDNQSLIWEATKDPCAIELGGGWRIPTYSEWYNADANNAWSNYNNVFNSVLKIHTAGLLNNTNGSLINRGISGYYWTSYDSGSNTAGSVLGITISNCAINASPKSYGFSIRCIRD